MRKRLNNNEEHPIVLTLFDLTALLYYQGASTNRKVTIAGVKCAMKCR
jgi:hypothetical protein